MEISTTPVEFPTAVPGPVYTAKLTITVSSDTLLSDYAIAAILKKVAAALTSYDASFTSSRFLMELDLSDPYLTSVTITGHITDIPVSVAYQHSAAINSNLVELDYDSCSLVSVAEGQISRDCANGCLGDVDCGLCFNGSICEGEDCRENSTMWLAAATALMIVTLVVAVAL
jgi:hypothetical protein